MELVKRMIMPYGDKQEELFLYVVGEVWRMVEEGHDGVDCYYTGRIMYPGHIANEPHGGEIGVTDEYANSKGRVGVMGRAYQRMKRGMNKKEKVEKDMRLWAEKMGLPITRVETLEAKAV